MKIDLSLQPTRAEHAFITAHQMDEKLQQAVQLLASIGGDDTITEQSGPRHAFIATHGHSIVVVPFRTIFLARAEEGHVQLLTSKGEVQTRARLYELEETLGPDFIRISKSVIVNMNAIDRIDPSIGGAVSVKLVDGTVEWISRRFLSSFKSALGM